MKLTYKTIDAFLEGCTQFFIVRTNSENNNHTIDLVAVHSSSLVTDYYEDVYTRFGYRECGKIEFKKLVHFCANLSSHDQDIWDGGFYTIIGNLTELVKWGNKVSDSTQRRLEAVKYREQVMA